MREALDRAAGRRGSKGLRRLILRLDDLPLTRSELERRFLRLVHDAELPAPIVNHTKKATGWTSPGREPSW